MNRRLLTLLGSAGVSAGVLALVTAAGAQADTDGCGLPTERPLWIEYGEGSVPREVREVFSRPGVTLAASGRPLARAYRARGAATVHFELKLPRSVGTAGRPADPDTVVEAADAMYDRAVASTECAEPWIGLNELNAPAAPTPWSPSVARYRANVLALLARLAERGAVPVLFVHGNPNVAGEAAAWWREVGAVAHIAYESYHDAVVLDRLGRILGPRRIRLGMRSAVRRFASVGVPRERVGLVLGFQVGPGKKGREGLQPRESWLRVVKWNTLAAQQVARELGLSTIWSWGWGTYGPESADPDKPLAACVHLWARDEQLCDAPAAAGPAFNRSRVEGAIVIPAGVRCVSAAGRLGRAAVDRLSRLTGGPRLAFDAAFSRHALRRKVPVPAGEILAAERGAVERAFAGSHEAYAAALAERGSTVADARGVIADELRRYQAALLLEPDRTVLEWITDTISGELDTITCLGDDLPGSGDFPRSDRREVATVPLASFLPFLFDDTTAPAVPTELRVERAGGGVLLDWADGAEPDLAGYLVYRTPTAGGEPVALTSAPIPRSRFLDVPSAGDPSTASTYTVRAVDTSLNPSDSSPPATVPLDPLGSRRP
jgi:hypothetical protein